MLKDDEKVARFGWAPVDAPGRLEWLDKTTLRVDCRYQRDAVHDKVLALARDWSWLAAGVLLVAERDGGVVIYDGQHRWLAAMRRTDIPKLPCLVFRTSSTQEEATAFLRANANRKPLDTVAKYRALLHTGDVSATLVARLLASAGREPSSTARMNTVRCLGVLLTHARTNPAALERVWPLVVKICRGNVLHERILSSLMYIDTHLAAGQSVAKPPWSEVAERAGYDGLMSAITRMSAAYERGGGKVWALGALEALNKGRHNRLRLVGQDDE